MVAFISNYLLMLLLTTILCCSTVVNAEEKEYILEFSSVAQTESFIKDNKNNIAHIRHTYDSDILTGTAVEFINEKVAKRALLSSNIVQYWPIHHRITQQAPLPSSFKNNEDKNSTSSTIDEDEDSDVITTFVPQNNNTLRVLTQANYVYQGLKSNGAGIKVGIIDSGIDYTLPALGGCFGPGCKVAFGHDLVGNDFDGTQSSIKESNDPIDNCPANSTTATGHGTFIAGVIAAEDKEYNWSGVAPGVTLGMWKVYGCKTAFAPNDIMIKAMEMAYKASMDVVNLSFGLSGGWAEDVLSVVADRLVSRGIHVVAATGNIGGSGIFLTASPATGRNVITAGSIVNKHVPGYILKLYNSNKRNNNIVTTEIPYRTFVNSPLVLNGILPLVPTNKQFNAENDACHSLTSGHQHHQHNDHNQFYGSIALVHIGGCDPLKKIMHARDAGARAVILYTDIKNGTTNYQTLSNAVLPVAFINNDDARLAFEASESQFTNTLIAMEAPETDQTISIAGFSSLGPTNELDLKPELMAVGGNVFSTLPRYRNSYGFRSGTSFSAPYIAGSVALFLANTRSDMSLGSVKDLLMNSARQVKDPISAAHYGDSPIRQGAGVIDVVQAIENYNNNRFHVSPAKLSLNDTAHFQNNGTLITIYNHNTEKEVVFYLSHLPSLTVAGYSLDNNNDTSTNNYSPKEPIGLYPHNGSVAQVEFPTGSKLVIPPSASVQVRVLIKPPTDVFNLETHVLYGGYIAISSTEEEGNSKATIPYFGMIGNMHDLPILDHSTNPSPSAQYTFPSIGLANGLEIIKPNQIGHFHIQRRNNTITGGPYILARLLTGTKILQIQVLDKQNQVIGDIPIDETRIYMMRNTLIVTEYSKSYYTWHWNGDYVPQNVTLSGSNMEYEPKPLPSGLYALKIRGLRVFGDIENDKDWDEWTSPQLMLKID